MIEDIGYVDTSLTFGYPIWPPLPILPLMLIHPAPAELYPQTAPY